MPQKVFMGAEFGDQLITCDVVIIGDYTKVLNEATEHLVSEHQFDPDAAQIIIQTIRDYNEEEDGPPHSCSHV